MTVIAPASPGLKTYSTVLLMRGYHSLFFPGGTRSRSGAVESRLKLGRC